MARENKINFRFGRIREQRPENTGGIKYFKIWRTSVS